MLYTQVDDIAGSRIYVRNDRLALIRREAGPAKTR
jgi:hypothetical protein